MMKAKISLLFSTILLLACQSKNENAETDASKTQENVVAKPAEKSGLELMTMSDCFTCHKPSGVLIGPSFDEIGKKYSDKDIPYLAKKVIEGGVGVWGEVPMAPHPNISQEDAEIMVQYILERNK